MKNKSLKRLTGLLALIMCCAVLFSANAAQAYAASQTCTTYTVFLPRDGDANQVYSSEAWGHPARTFMNGWHSNSDNLTRIHCMDSYNGRICYCIEPGVRREMGESMSGFGEDFWDNYPEELNSTIQPDDIKILLGRIMQYGYQGNVSNSWHSQDPADADKIAHAYATQILVWETIVGERDAAFSHVDTGGYDPIKSVVRPGHPLYDKINAYYDSIVSSVQNHAKIPSFMKKSSSGARQVELKWNGSEYTAALTDTNGVLSDFTFSANSSDISFSKSGNKLIISSPTAPADTVTVTASKSQTRSGVITWSDGKPQSGTHQDSVTYSATVSDPVKAFLKVKVSAGYVKIIKEDAETGCAIPCVGAGFKIYRPDGSPVAMTMTYPTVTTIDTFYTGDDGTLITPEDLEYGTGYWLEEVSSPYGYVLSGEKIFFDITKDSSSGEDALKIVEVSFPDMPQKGVIRISKSGEVFSNVTESAGVYQPVYGEQGLSGAVYEITAAEDIRTPDGTLRYTSGELVDTVVTGEDGTAESRPLYLGRYKVRETEAPYGMVMNTEPYCAELVYAGQEIGITDTSVSFMNVRQKAQIDLTKVLEQDEQFGIGMNDEYSAVTFGFYAAEDIEAADGSVIPEGGLIEVIPVDGNGKAVLKTDIPFGSYYVQEISTDCHYILSDEKYPVTFEYQGQEVGVVSLQINGGSITNELIYGEIAGVKRDENGNGLAGAVIGLFTAAGQEPVMTAVSADDGSFSFNAVPCGEYELRELEAPEGYVLNETPYAVSIDHQDAVIEAEITDTIIRGSVQLTKVDKDYPDHHLSGAVFEVYSGDSLIGVMEEISDGVYRLDGLKYGEYTLRETVAPEGFYPDENIYSFSITQNGETVIVDNETGGCFIDQAQTGRIRIRKTSSDGVLAGFTFRVTGTDITGNTFSREYVTGETGEILIENLRIGEYVVHEVKNSANAGYILPHDVKVTVHAEKTVVAKFYNRIKPVDIPKTGDVTNMTLWAVLAGASLLGALASAFFTIGRKNEV